MRDTVNPPQLDLGHFPSHDQPISAHKLSNFQTNPILPQNSSTRQRPERQRIGDWRALDMLLKRFARHHSLPHLIREPIHRDRFQKVVEMTPVTPLAPIRVSKDAKDMRNTEWKRCGGVEKDDRTPVVGVPSSDLSLGQV